MQWVREPTAFEKEVVIATSAGTPLKLSEKDWEESGIVAAASAVEGINQVWVDDRRFRLMSASRRHLESDDPSIVAAVGSRVGLLAVKWEEDRTAAERRLLPIARVAAQAQPNWVFNNLFYFECLLASEDFDTALEIAHQLRSLASQEGSTDPFQQAVEVMFSGTFGWRPDHADVLIERAEQHRPY